MRVVIIKDDNAVNVDGVRRTVDLGDLPADFHAMQWYDTWGEIEYRMVNCEHCGGRNKKPNLVTGDLSPYQKYVDAWHVEDARVKAAEAAEALARAEAASAAGPQT
jgi:hypothetical protein